MDEWYYALNGAQQGPVARAVLMQLLSSGQVSPDSLVWREGMGDWVAANTLPELAESSTSNFPTGVQPVLGYGVADSAYLPANLNVSYAGFWIRFAGYVIDLIVMWLVTVIIDRIASPMIVAAGGRGPSAIISGVAGVEWTISTAIGWLYVALMQASTRQATLGQMATSLRVTDLQGRRITFARATGRYFATILSACMVWIGYLMMLWSPTKQTLHDKIAGTLVLTK